ncbi:MYXO-CTERM sorting domain-containing protein [Nannocystis radixulma]|uniref:MYXO-CTERM sorting domain-containing protein n=1 Tax=Nannocystis radixulma TaxID=2995305 RepID=A0ABT5B5U4_9BACT|nr:MYXO-CTERM sorting domain-containing protein [Nannocystis radixulma]MDC0669461.1 MYXO-CTERM sorting domain-containing protein [Nannocystis radixulma]
MPDNPVRSRLLALSILLAAPCLPGTARAELPKPADFEVEYFVTNEAGERGRVMTADDHQRFLNRARCQCGQQVGIDLRMVNPSEDNAQLLRGFIGTQCAIAETMLAGQFRRCGEFFADLIPALAAGVTGAFHPLFLASGVDPTSPSRGIHVPETRLSSPSCDAPVTGEAGLWMCSPNENTLSGCQQDEFFIGSDDALSGLSGIPRLAFDFSPPLAEPSNLTVEPGNGSAELRWELPVSGDIHGFRVLCEEADGGAAPELDFPAPTATDAPDGQSYFTAANLCGDQPFSTVAVVAPEVTDPNTCGNGVVEAGEACDDGLDNDDDGLCDTACNLRVSPGLHALDWAHVCSDHVAFSEKSVAIGGLDNGKAYNFVLVAYDQAGNPRAHHRIVTATPDESLPDLLPDAAEGCACTSSPEGHGLLAMSLGTLALLALRRRRA